MEQQGFREHEGHAGPGHARFARAIFLPRIDQRQRRGQLGADRVVIGDDDVEPGAHAVSHFRHRANPAINGDDELDALSCQLLQRRRIKAVAFVRTVGDIRSRISTQRAQDLHHESSRTDAIGIKIAVDGNGLPRRNGCGDPRHRDFHVFHLKWVFAELCIAYECIGLGGVFQAAAVEQLSQDWAEFQVAPQVLGRRLPRQDPFLLHHRLRSNNSLE